MVLRIKEREKKPSSYQLWTRRSVVNYSRFIGKAIELMQKPSMIESPSDRSREKAPRWDLTGKEGCGSGKVVSWLPLMFLGIRVYIGGRSTSVELRGAHEGGGVLTPQARPPASQPSRCVSDFHSKSPGCLLVQEKSLRRFYSVWTPFGIPFLRNSKTRKKQELAVGSRLIGQSRNNIKQHINVDKTSKTDNIIAWNNENLQIRWRRIKHPQA